MSPNGSLIAYSTPADMLQVRDQAALISMAWREHSEKGTSTHSSRVNLRDSTTQLGGLKALTVEFGSYNIIARAIQLNLILVLVGGVAGRENYFKVTPEKIDDSTYPPGEVDSTTAMEDATALQLQRKKADKIAEFIENEAKIFSMPGDTQLGKPFS